MREMRLDLATFCARLGLDEAAARGALEAPGAVASHSPVYIQALFAVGAWIAALLMIGFVLVLLALVIEIEDEAAMSVVAVIGAAIFAAGAALQRGKPAGGFGHHFASALLAAGAILAPVAVGFQSQSYWAAAAAAALATGAAALLGRDRAAQFLAAMLTAGLVAGGFLDAGLPFLIELAALAAGAGALLLFYPPRLDLAPTAAVLLLAMPCLVVMLFGDVLGLGFPGMGFSAAWMAWSASLTPRVIQAGLILWLLYRHRALSGQSGIDVTTAALGVAFVAVALVLPPGGSAALMLMLLAFVLGLRGLALIGVLFQIYFVGRFYYDLDATLLDKSLILMAVGVLVLGAYATVARQPAGTRLPEGAGS